MSTRQSKRTPKLSVKLTPLDELPNAGSSSAALATPGKGRGKGKVAVKPAPQKAARGRGKKTLQDEPIQAEDQEEEEEDDDPDRLYCICRQPEGGRKMIGCDNCGEWYHYKCIKMTETQAEDIESYICATCNEASKGDLKTVRRSDISRLPSPPRSPDPALVQAPVRGRPKKGTGRGKGRGKKGQAATEVDVEVDVDMDVGPAGSVEVEMGEGEMQVDDKMEDEQRFKSDPESEDEESESESGGSVYGGEKDKNADEEEDGEVKGRGRKRKAGTRDDEDGSASDGEISAVESSAKPSKRSRTTQLRGRGSVISPSTTPNSKQKTSRRKGSAVEAGPPSSGKGKEAKPTVQVGLGKMREFALEKFKAGFRTVFMDYRKRQLSEEIKAYRKAEKEDAEEVPEDADAMITETTEIEAEDEPEEEMEIELPDGEKEELEKRAEAYAVKVEEAVYEKKKERTAEGRYEAKGIYRTFLYLVLGALSENLRPDLEEGFATGRIAPEDVASMTSRDLATAETLRNIQKNEAQSLKATIRYEDDTVPVRYTKKALEDADTLRALQENIARDARRDRGEEEAEPEASPGLENRDEADGDVQATRENSVELDDIAEEATEERNKSPETVSKTAPPPEAPQPAPQLVQTQQRQSSFSLSSVLGSSVPAAPTATPDMNGDDDDDQGSGGFNDGFVDDNVGSDDGSDIDYSGRKDNAATKLSRTAALEAARHKFDKLPVVWSGTLVNYASKEDGYPRVEARYVGGLEVGLEPATWKHLMTDNPMEFDGRVEENKSSDYLASTQLSPSKDLVVVAMTPLDTPQDRESFAKLITFHTMRKRHGVHIPKSSGGAPGYPKEIYMVPMPRLEHREYSFIDLLDRCEIPKPMHRDMILGVIVAPRRVPVPPSTTPAPAAIPPPQGVGQPAAQAPLPPAQPSIAPSITDILATLRHPAMVNILQNSVNAPAAPLSPTPSPSTVIPNPMSSQMPPPTLPVMPPFAGTLRPMQTPPFPPPGSPQAVHNSPAAFVPSITSGFNGTKPSPPVHPSRLAHIPGGSPPGLGQHQTPPQGFARPSPMSPYGGLPPPSSHGYDPSYGQHRPGPGRGRGRGRGMGRGY